MKPHDCKEALPKQYAEVLAYHPDICHWFLAYFDGREWWDERRGHPVGIGVTHWTEEPPKP